MISRLLIAYRQRAANRLAAAQIWRECCAAARLPFFYTECGVADSVDGRFEMLILQLFLATEKLETKPQRQALFDHAFADLDHNLREMGVGDLSVGKKIRAMASVFYGRVGQYRVGLDADQQTLAATLEALVPWRENAGKPAVLAGWMRQQWLPENHALSVAG
jgi:cytochrome b pre-mRNA-processing protein 3